MFYEEDFNQVAFVITLLKYLPKTTFGNVQVAMYETNAYK